MDSQGDSTYLETARLRVDEFRAIWKFSDLACCQCKPRFHAFATATSCVAHDSDCHLTGISGPDPTVHVRYQRRGRRRWESAPLPPPVWSVGGIGPATWYKVLVKSLTRRGDYRALDQQ